MRGRDVERKCAFQPECDVEGQTTSSSRRQSKDDLSAAELSSTTKDGRSFIFIKGGWVSRNGHDTGPTLASMLPARSLAGCWVMGVGILNAGEIGNVILYVDGLCIETMWILEANTSDFTGEAGVKVMKGTA
jgi:hypothetical protein